MGHAPGTGSATDLRRYNRDAALRLIKTHGAISRTEIATHVGLTNAAVSRIIKELIDAGLVEEGERIAPRGPAGRRQVALRLSAEGAYVVGIAVTLNAREVVVAGGRGDIIGRVDCTDISLDDPQAALVEFANRAATLIRRTGIDRRRLIGGAASVAGRVDPGDGRIIGAGPLDWNGQTVGAAFEDLLDMPFVSEGRAAALLQIERQLGPAAGLDDILLVNVGLKMGTALMIDGALLRGASSRAFALERYPMAPGKTLDDTASGFAVLARLEALGHARPKATDPGAFLRRIVDGDISIAGRAASAFRNCGRALGKAIAQLAPVLSPQRVILAGFVVRHPGYVAGVRAQLEDAPFELQISQFTTAQSAVQLALDHHLFNTALDIDRLIAA